MGLHYVAEEDGQTKLIIKKGSRRMHLSALRRKFFVKLLYALLFPNQMLLMHICIQLDRWPKKKSDQGKRMSCVADTAWWPVVLGPAIHWFPVAISVTDESAN
jgi:hypothetical protein